MLDGLRSRLDLDIMEALHVVLRLLQFVLAITVAGLYGVDLHAASKAHAYTDGRWVYAEVVAGLSAVSVFVYYVCRLKIMCVWDLFMFILWTALFGIFGKIYIPAHPTPKQSGQIRMKHAVWVDLVNMLLWLTTFFFMGAKWFGGNDRKRSMHTGRAHV